MTKALTLTCLEQLYLAVHEHQYGATLYLFRWTARGPLLLTDDEEPLLASQLGLQYEPELGEHLMCLPIDEIVNLRQPPDVSLTASSGEKP